MIGSAVFLMSQGMMFLPKGLGWRKRCTHLYGVLHSWRNVDLKKSFHLYNFLLIVKKMWVMENEKKRKKSCAWFGQISLYFVHDCSEKKHKIMFPSLRKNLQKQQGFCKRCKSFIQWCSYLFHLMTLFLNGVGQLSKFRILSLYTVRLHEQQNEEYKSNIHGFLGCACLILSGDEWLY